MKERRLEKGTLAEFLTLLKELEEKDLGESDAMIYRGQTSATWPLTPKLLRDPKPKRKEGRNCKAARPDDRDDKLAGETATRIEARLFDEFSNYLTAFRPDLVSVGGELERPAQQWRILALARHYGVPTRFIDFTTSPLAALYFAVEGDAEVVDDALKDAKRKRLDSAVWGVNAPNRLKVWQVPQQATESHELEKKLTPVKLSLLMLWFAVYAKSQRKNGAVRKACREVWEEWKEYYQEPPKMKEPSQEFLTKVAFVPDHVDTRMVAQGSLFMYELSHKSHDHRLGALLGKEESTVKIVIPEKFRTSLRDQLDKIGVNRASLFPDLTGVGAYLSWSVYERKRGYREMGRTGKEVS